MPSIVFLVSSPFCLRNSDNAGRISFSSRVFSWSIEQEDNFAWGAITCHPRLVSNQGSESTGEIK